MIIAIDGPAASGKSTTAKIIAQELGFIYIDTGAMYRAVAYYTLENQINIDDFLAIDNMLDHIDIKFENINNQNQILLNNKNVNTEIRSPEVGNLASKVATKKIIREKMVDLQREFAKDNDVVLDGRDIGTVVFPDADFKFFIIASIDVRAQRRHKELLEKGINQDLEDIRQDLIWRDKNDTEREFSPLTQADDAIVVDTSNMNIEEQVKYILKVIQEDIA